MEPQQGEAPPPTTLNFRFSAFISLTLLGDLLWYQPVSESCSGGLNTFCVCVLLKKKKNLHYPGELTQPPLKD